MVRHEPFQVEQWMDEYEETPGVLNVAETCCSSLSIDELCQLSKDDASGVPFNTKTRLTYGAIRGSQVLRERVADLCSAEGGTQLSPNDVIITSGAINANFLLFYSLVGPGDHIVCVYPTYQQLYSVPASLGAEVSLWKLREESDYVPDVDELGDLVNENTKMIIINNPNNPSGATIPSGTLHRIADLARQRNIILFSDEVYRPLFHDGFEDNPNQPPPATSLGYHRTVVTGSMSKAFALAGIRVGWIASPDKAIMAAVAEARDYTTISVSQVDDQIARFALSPGVQKLLLARNVALARRNRGLLEEFVRKHGDTCRWVRPTAGTTAFVQFTTKRGEPVKDVDFCTDLLDKTSVFLVPGSRCFGRGVDFGGYVRIGYVCETRVLEQALERLDQYVAEHLT